MGAASKVMKQAQPVLSQAFLHRMRAILSLRKDAPKLVLLALPVPSFLCLLLLLLRFETFPIKPQTPQLQSASTSTSNSSLSCSNSSFPQHSRQHHNHCRHNQKQWQQQWQVKRLMVGSGPEISVFQNLSAFRQRSLSCPPQQAATGDRCHP